MRLEQLNTTGNNNTYNLITAILAGPSFKAPKKQKDEKNQEKSSLLHLIEKIEKELQKGEQNKLAPDFSLILQCLSELEKFVSIPGVYDRIVALRARMEAMETYQHHPKPDAQKTLENQEEEENIIIQKNAIRFFNPHNHHHHHVHRKIEIEVEEKEIEHKFARIT